ARLTYRHKRLQRLVENVPTVLIRHGEVVHANLDREHMSMAELRAALRKEGVASVSEVRWAILEEDGRVSVVHRGAQPAETPSSAGSAPTVVSSIRKWPFPTGAISPCSSSSSWATPASPCPRSPYSSWRDFSCGLASSGWTSCSWWG